MSVKMLLIDVHKIPIALSLGVIVGILAVAVIASIRRPASAAVSNAGR